LAGDKFKNLKQSSSFLQQSSPLKNFLKIYSVIVAETNKFAALLK